MKTKLILLSVILLGSLSAVAPQAIGQKTENLQDDDGLVPYKPHRTAAKRWTRAGTPIPPNAVIASPIQGSVWFDNMPTMPTYLYLRLETKNGPTNAPEYEFKELERKSLSFALMLKEMTNLKPAYIIRITPVTSALDCRASASEVNGCYSPMTHTIFIQPEIMNGTFLKIDNTLIHELRHAFQHAKLGDKAVEYCDLSLEYYRRRCERDAEAFSVRVTLEAYGKWLESILKLQNPDQIKIIEVYIKATNDDNALTLPFLANETQ